MFNVIVLWSRLKKVGVDVDADVNIWKVISMAAVEIEGDLWIDFWLMYFMVFKNKSLLFILK